MKFNISFSNLPFRPEKDQVIYVENVFHKDINDMIVQNYNIISDFFRCQNKEFVYLPYLTSRESVSDMLIYYAPYIQNVYDEIAPASNDYLLKFMTHPENRNMFGPSLLYGGETESDCVVYQGIEVNSDVYSFLQNFRDYVDDVRYSFDIVGETEPLYQKVGRPEEPEIRFSIRPGGSGIPSRDLLKEALKKKSNEEFEECNNMLKELERIVSALEVKGISRAVIQQYIHEEEKLSRMVITPDYRILLPDYNNIEIKMHPLSKAVYFFFLLHPEGVVLKHLPDHSKELYNIYMQLRPKTSSPRLQVTIEELTDPTNNRMNEVLSHIRCAFTSKFDKHLATHYYVNGSKGLEYKIVLPPELIVWDE